MEPHSFSFVEQECLFRHLVLLFRHANGAVQDAAREALLRLNVCSLFLFFLFIYFFCWKYLLL